MSGQSSGDTARRFRWQLRRTRSWLMNWRCSDAVFDAGFGPSDVPVNDAPRSRSPWCANTSGRKRQERFAFSSDAYGCRCRPHGSGSQLMTKFSCRLTRWCQTLFSAMGLGWPQVSDLLRQATSRRSPAVSRLRAMPQAGGIFGHDNLLRRHAQCETDFRLRLRIRRRWDFTCRCDRQALQDLRPITRSGRENASP
jgi:hypothetical protein